MDADRPTQYFVVSDSSGPVGVFTSELMAEEMVTRKYSLIPFIIQKFAVAAGDIETVWVVLYRDINAVAFVSNDRSEADRIKTVYGTVGFSYEDSIDYWQIPINTICKPAEDRLKSLSNAHNMYAGPSVLEDIKQREAEDLARLDLVSGAVRVGENGSTLIPVESPITEVLRKFKRISILDGVIPYVASATDPVALDEDYVMPTIEDIK